MFTGIVVETGEIVKATESPGGGRALWVRAACLGDVQIGASVAVDGVCLTVTERDAETCRFDLSPESLARSTLSHRDVGDRVNLERPLRAGDELGGHIVQGHVDAVGEVVAIAEEGADRRMTVGAPGATLRYIVEKGSITVDGVSLTITRAGPEGFEVALVPHTLEVTTLGRVARGQRVNLEVDILAKYVERLAHPYRDPTQGPESMDEASGYL